MVPSVATNGTMPAARHEEAVAGADRRAEGERRDDGGERPVGLQADGERRRHRHRRADRDVDAAGDQHHRLAEHQRRVERDLAATLPGCSRSGNTRSPRTRT